MKQNQCRKTFRDTPIGNHDTVAPMVFYEPPPYDDSHEEETYLQRREERVRDPGMERPTVTHTKDQM